MPGVVSASTMTFDVMRGVEVVRGLPRRSVTADKEDLMAVSGTIAGFVSGIRLAPGEVLGAADHSGVGENGSQSPSGELAGRCRDRL